MEGGIHHDNMTIPVTTSTGWLDSTEVVVIPYVGRLQCT